MLVVSSPSGAGKTTVTRLLRENEPNLKLSISVTTRARRPSEVQAVHYHFLSRADFFDQVNRGELLEWAQVHENFYGTPAKPVLDALSRGDDILFDIDWQGTLQLYAKVRSYIASVFILPPSFGELKNRLVRRAEDSSDVIRKRLQNSIQEMLHWPEYDYVIVNNDIQTCLHQIRTILEAERVKRYVYPYQLTDMQNYSLGLANSLKRESNPGIATFVSEILTEAQTLGY